MHFFPKIFIQLQVSRLAFNAKKVSIPKLWKLFKPWRYLFAKSFNCGSQMKSEVPSWIYALLPPLYTFIKISLAKFDDSFPWERFLDKIWWNIPTEVVGIFRCTYNGEKTCLEFSNLQNPLLSDYSKWDEALHWRTFLADVMLLLRRICLFLPFLYFCNSVAVFAQVPFQTF